MSISVLFIFRHAINLCKLKYYLKFGCMCSLRPYHFLSTEVSWNEHKCAMTCVRVLLTLQYIHTKEKLMYLLSFKELVLQFVN